MINKQYFENNIVQRSETTLHYNELLEIVQMQQQYIEQLELALLEQKQTINKLLNEKRTSDNRYDTVEQQSNNRKGFRLL